MDKEATLKVLDDLQDDIFRIRKDYKEMQQRIVLQLTDIDMLLGDIGKAKRKVEKEIP